MKLPVIWGLSIALLLVPCRPVLATQTQSIKQLEQNKQKYEQNIKNTKDALNEAKANEKSISDEIYKLDESVSKAQAELDAVDESLSKTTELLAQSQQQLEQAIIKKDQQNEAFGERLNFIQQSGSIGYLQAILKAQTLGDMLTRMQYINDIMNYDKATLDMLKENQTIIEVKTSEIKTQKDKQELLVAEQRTKTKELTDKLALKQQAAESYRKDAAKYQQELESWTSASNEVERLIAQAEKEKAAAAKKAAEAAQKSAAAKNQNTTQSQSAPVPVTYSGGQFAWPVPGQSRISSGYGYRNRPIGSGREFHTGIDIPGPYGTNIVAAADGNVITSGYVNGFGYTIMIDHGGGLVTLYGHNSKLTVSKGESVKKGQAIAKCGSTGNSTGNHSHFEVRKNGKHTSPLPYLGM